MYAASQVIWEAGRCKDCHVGELLFSQEEATGELFRLCRRCLSPFRPDSIDRHLSKAAKKWPRSMTVLAAVPATRAVIESGAVIVESYPTSAGWPVSRIETAIDGEPFSLNPRFVTDAHPAGAVFAVSYVTPAPALAPGISVLEGTAAGALTPLWRRPNAIDFRWTRRGSEVVVLDRVPERHPAEIFVERWTWPSRERIQRFTLPECDLPIGLACSPDGRFFAVTTSRVPPPRVTPQPPPPDPGVEQDYEPNDVVDEEIGPAPDSNAPPAVSTLHVWAWRDEGAEQIASVELSGSSHVLRPRCHRGVFLASAGRDRWWIDRAPRRDTNAGALLMINPLTGAVLSPPVVTRTKHGWYPIDASELVTPGIPRSLGDGRLAIALPGSGGKEALFEVPS